MSWVCVACEYENEADDVVCAACEESRPTADTKPGDEEDEYAHYKVGIIVACEPIPNAKLKHLKVDVGDADAIHVVTAAGNVRTDQRVVVACVGAAVKGDVVTRTVIKGYPSQGMLCDAGMLGWKGGEAGAAVTLDNSFAVGGRPPRTRPRTDGAHAPR